MTVSQTVILASGSKIRKQLLEAAGVRFDVKVARVDEGSIKASLLSEGAKPNDVADVLAEMKARQISSQMPDGLVIGCDQVLVCNGKIYDKATTLDDAREVLKELRGQAHSLLSAAVIYEKGSPVWRHTGRAQLVMRNFSDDFLEEYLSSDDELLHSVGCYRLEDAGVQLFSRIQGDYFSVLGLPLLEILDFLRTRGVIST